jgi:hypothetical protein
MTAEPKDRLSDEIIKTLRQFGLPFEGLIRNADLVKAKIFRAKDFRRRQRKLVQSNRCKTGPGKAVAGRPVASVA